MTPCTIYGCRQFDVKCADCGRRVCERLLPMPYWIWMKDMQPTKGGPIYFRAKDGLCDENIGDVWLEKRRVLLRRTDLTFDEIEMWYPLPGAP